jgi:plasmid maintenance system antidote protein VapI
MLITEHPLRRYLREHQVSITELARDLRVQRSTVYTVLAGENLTLDLAYRIMQTTKGEVSLNELARHLSTDT